MVKLYLDFDGVILDTARKFDPLLKANNIPRSDKTAVLDFLTNLDWVRLIAETDQINDSIAKINLLLNSKLYDIAILTHINSREEAQAKIKYLDRQIPGIKVIPTPKSIDKHRQVEPQGAILVDDYLENLIPWHQAGALAIKFADDTLTDDFLTIDSLDHLISLYPQILDNNLPKIKKKRNFL